MRFALLFAVSATACFCAAPMGWNSWNSFANIVNSQIVQQQAKALASNGMKEAGYEYVVIDEGWWLGERDGAGNIVVDPKQWPALKPGQKDGDMANIAGYIHSLGLKAGIYTACIDAQTDAICSTHRRAEFKEGACPCNPSGVMLQQGDLERFRRARPGR